MLMLLRQLADAAATRVCRCCYVYDVSFHDIENVSIFLMPLRPLSFCRPFILCVGYAAAPPFRRLPLPRLPLPAAAYPFCYIQRRPPAARRRFFDLMPPTTHAHYFALIIAACLPFADARHLLDVIRQRAI